LPQPHPDFAELTTTDEYAKAELLSSPTYTKSTISTNFTDPFARPGSICSLLMQGSVREFDAEWASCPSAHGKSSCVLTPERPKACADRAMKLLLAAGRHRSSWTLQSRKPRVLVIGLASIQKEEAIYPGQQPLSLSAPAHSDTTSPGVAIISRLRTRWDVTVEFTDPDVTAVKDICNVNGLEVSRFDDKSKWHTMGLSWFDLVIVIEPVHELGLDEEALTRLTRTVVVDFNG